MNYLLSALEINYIKWIPVLCVIHLSHGQETLHFTDILRKNCLNIDALVMNITFVEIYAYLNFSDISQYHPYSHDLY